MALSELEYNLLRADLDAEDFGFMHLTTDTDDDLETIEDWESQVEVSELGRGWGD